MVADFCRTATHMLFDTDSKNAGVVAIKFYPAITEFAQFDDA
jgi:hypothetical protein